MRKYGKFLAIALVISTAGTTIPVTTAPITAEAASISLNKKSLTLATKDSYALKLTGAKGVSWASKNKAIATVNKSGKVTAKKAGKTMITATYKGKTYKCAVVVKAPKISNAKVSMAIGGTKQLSVLYTISRVQWRSSKPSVAVVNRKGVVTGKKAGTTVITAVVNGKKFSSTVKVSKASTKVRLNASKSTVKIGGSETLKLNNASGRISWKSSNKDVASVNSKGIVKGLRPGKTVITATNGRKSYKCTVTVPKPKLKFSNGKSINYGETTTVTMTGVEGKVKWESDLDFIATINSKGVITPVDNTSATVSFTATVGKYTMEFSINTQFVPESYNDVFIGGSYSFLEKGETITDYDSEFVKIEDGKIIPIKTTKQTKVTVKGKNSAHFLFLTVKEPTFLKQTVTITEGSKKTVFRDCASTVSWSVADTSIASVNSKSTVTAKKPGKTTLTATIGSKKYTCTLVVEKDKNALPDKKEYDESGDDTVATLSNGDIVRTYMNNYDVPMEARIDIFKLTHLDTSATQGKVYEEPYTAGLGHYLEYNDYYVINSQDWFPDSKDVFEESYDRVYDLFKELGILDQPDYVKAREIAVWMKSTKTYGEIHSVNGTWLGVDKCQCQRAASIYQEFMWLLDIPCKLVTSEKLNHAWNVIQLDGKWYRVDVTPNDGEVLYDRPISSILDIKYEDEDNSRYLADLYAIGGKANAGKDYMSGSKLLFYDTIEDFYTALADKNSQLWENYNNDRGLAACIKSFVANEDTYSELNSKIEFVGREAHLTYGSFFLVDKNGYAYNNDDNSIVTCYVITHSPTWNGHPNISTHPETYNPKLKPLSSYLK